MVDRGRRPRGRVTVVPATAKRWDDLAALFGERGACAGCWCMFWRRTGRAWEQGKGPGNRRAFRRLVKSGTVPGVLAYAGEEAVGWCAIAPRADYPRLARSRVLAPLDDRPVWSVSCLFVARPWRRRGISGRLVRGAVDLARERGARIVEAYPVEPRRGQAPDAFVWTGLPSAFRRAGFREVARRSPTRPLMRRTVRPRRG